MELPSSFFQFNPHQNLIDEEVFKDLLYQVCLLHKLMPEKLHQLEMAAGNHTPYSQFSCAGNKALM